MRSANGDCEGAILLSKKEIPPALEAAKKIRKFIRGKLGLEKQKRLL